MTKDICPSRDGAQSHIFENGHCVMCLKPTPEQKEIRTELERMQQRASHNALLKYAQKKRDRGDSADSVMDVIHFANAFFPVQT